MVFFTHFTKFIFVYYQLLNNLQQLGHEELTMCLLESTPILFKENVSVVGFIYLVGVLHRTLL